jgi:hypothetical protein
MACNSNTQISLDVDCLADVTYDMILSAEDTSCPNGQFSVSVQDLYGVEIPTSPSVTVLNIGETLIAEVTDNNSGNSCWGNIHIEDKMAPFITCENDTIECYEMENFQPTVDENCGTFSLMILNEVESGIDCNSPDADLFIKRITRTYQATDDSGNTSNTCSIDILLRRFDHGAVVCPDSFLVVDQTALACDEGYEVDSEGHPHPNRTGIPTINGIALWPNFNFYCNVSTTYTDIEFPEVNCVTKIMRMWTIQEWVCGGDSTTTCIQLIEIEDDAAPTYACPDDITVTTEGYSCEASVYIPALDATDNCSDEIEVDIAYPGGFGDDWQGGYITLPAGDNDITYTVYDGCLNSSSCLMTVSVEDHTPPVPVCDQNTVVAVTSDGTALVHAYTFDDGSYDECALGEMVVQRMDNANPCGYNDNQFAEYVRFCCEDISTSPIQVVFRVYDWSNNYNECMVNVTVQDKLPPTITCPADVTIECGTPYDVNDLSEYGEPEAYDNCNYVVTPSVFPNINQCGEGYLLRSWTVEDDGGRTDNCNQFVWVQNSSPFDGDTDVDWPDNVDVNGCIDPETLSPDETGYPVASEDICDLVGFSYEDHLFEIVNGNDACFKIIRKWKAIDWCQFNGNEYEVWYYDQIIKVRNLVDPVFTGDYPDLSMCTFDDQCLNGFIDLNASATDDCTDGDDLAWDYSIDYNNDGSFDIGPVSSTGSSVNASGNYPIGSHRIVWSVEDKCGNKVSMEQLFEIVNCKAATPYCINGLAVDLMPVDNDNDGIPDWGMVVLWATDFDAGSFHPCTEDIYISFSSDINDTNREFNCNDFSVNDGRVEVEIWASIEGSNGDLIQSFCNTYVIVQDNNDVCPDVTTTANVTGNIVTEESESIADVIVSLEGSEMAPQTTEVDGNYQFPGMPMGGDYIIDPAKNIDPMNGVSTLDLVMIQKHILGFEDLPTAYKRIAADINMDKSISATDLVELRKLILGVIDDFTVNESWRFVDGGYEFMNPENALNENFPEVYNINALDNDMAVEFIGIKTGDVNNSVVANNLLGATVRNAGENLAFYTNEIAFNKSEEVIVPVTAANFDAIIGYQFTIDFAEDVLSFNRVENGSLAVNESNFGFNRLEEGIITTSWNNASAVIKSKDEVLFNLVFDAADSGKLSNSISFNSRYTEAEAYNAANDLMNISLEFRTEDGVIADGSFELYQNTPNPFNNSTVIGFSLPEASQASLSIFDVTGKVIKEISSDFAKGYNQITVDKNELMSSGVLYYQLSYNGFTAVKKMVVIE